MDDRRMSNGIYVKDEIKFWRDTKWDVVMPKPKRKSDVEDD
jgi:hypothetical protein